MRSALYSKIALGNIKKNYRFFVPRILAETGLLGCFYIVLTLTMDERLSNVTGGAYLQVFMIIGTIVLIILSVILMLYLNSFLMKQRRQEYGVYNILGMEKRHIGRVMFWETLFSVLVSLALGLILGILFYKAGILLICRLLAVDSILGFYYISLNTILPAVGLFVAIDLLTFIFNRIAIARMKPVELLQSKATGEREPKIKWPIFIIGVIALGLGYFISLTTENPLQAMLLFFVAVALVILGTYFLFTAGSIFVLKCLKKNEKYYYNKKHMTAVSGLLYRMKQNAVGLASIAILATMVLVVISTTVSLYSGMEDTLKKNYPQEYYLSEIYFDNNDQSHRLTEEEAKTLVSKAAKKAGLEIKSMEEWEFLTVTYLNRDGVFVTTHGGIDTNTSMKDITTITYITEDRFVKLGGEKLNLKKDEIALCPLFSNGAYTAERITFEQQTFRVKKQLTYFPINTVLIGTTKAYGAVVSDLEVLKSIDKAQREAYGDYASGWEDRMAVAFTDHAAAMEKGRDFEAYVKEALDELYGEKGCVLIDDSVWDSAESLYGMYGSFLFLGILIGLVCLFATALIIYYKQISEGYEDRDRFQIMQKIGMSAKEVKKTINGQILLVFFLPLIVAGIHLLFAFPMLDKLLHLLLLSSTNLFIVCSIIVYVIFAAVYVLIYSATAKTYYKIVR